MVIFSQFTLKYVYFGSDDYNNDGDDDNDNDDYNDHGEIFFISASIFAPLEG